jgi:hypothetical protein
MRELNIRSRIKKILGLRGKPASGSLVSFAACFVRAVISWREVPDARGWSGLSALFGPLELTGEPT